MNPAKFKGKQITVFGLHRSGVAVAKLLDDLGAKVRVTDPKPADHLQADVDALKDQAIARAHRIGQKNEVRVYMPLIKDTIDYRIYELQQSKTELFKQLVDIV